MDVPSTLHRQLVGEPGACVSRLVTGVPRRYSTTLGKMARAQAHGFTAYWWCAALPAKSLPAVWQVGLSAMQPNAHRALPRLVACSNGIAVSRIFLCCWLGESCDGYYALYDEFVADKTGKTVVAIGGRKAQPQPIQLVLGA